MYDNVEKGRQGVMEALELLQRAHREKPRLFYMQLVMEAKRDELWHTYDEATKGIAEKTAHRLAAEGKLPGFKVGGSWRFKRSQIDDWIDRQATTQQFSRGTNK